MEHGFLTALVLAAGMSRRLGQPKQLLPFRGTTLLGWALAQVEDSPAVDDVLLVLGQDHDAILSRLMLRRAHPVIAGDYQEGCAASYRAGLAAADPRTDGVMIMPCDQPEIDSAIIGRVATVWRGVSHAIVVASYQGVLGHPFVFDRRMFPELAVLHGDKAAWRLIDRYRDGVYAIELERPAPRNINTLEDYASLTDQPSPSQPSPRHDARGDGQQRRS